MQVRNVLSSYEYTSADPSQFRYWSPSQRYASGDQLARCLQEGWGLGEEVLVETHWFGEARFINIYRVTLIRGDQQVTMRVMSNPFVRQLLRDPRLGLKLTTVRHADKYMFKVIGVN